MNTILKNVEFIRVTSPIPDWIIKADIYDADGTKLGDFGVDGTSVNEWWNNQSESFQLDILAIFINYIKDGVIS